MRSQEIFAVSIVPTEAIPERSEWVTANEKIF